MVTEDATNRILEYLKKQGQANTFRLARELGIDRHKILDIIRRLEEKEAIEFKSGMIRFLKFPAKERKIAKRQIEIKKVLPKQKKKVERKKAKAKPTILESIKAENKKLRERLWGLETTVKRYSNIKKKLQETIKELEKKARSPKIIRRTIVKKIPVKVKEKVIEAKPKKFKLPRFNIMKNIQQLRTPEFIEQKINIGKPKINFSELNKNVQQLHVPKMLKNP